MAKLLKPVVQFNVLSPMRQFRLAPIYAGGRYGFVIVHSNCAEVDPYHRMFFLPTDTLKLTAFSAAGELMWHRDLGKGMIPGIWFCPVLPFNLDGDEHDDIWLVANSDPDHALDYEAYVLERWNAADGRTMQSFPWPHLAVRQDMSHTYRNFINGGFARGRRRLITAQGTYGPMQLQCYDAATQLQWARRIEAAEPGARGSHMFPVVDLNRDGRDELLWGERCMDIDSGADLWVGDSPAWAGHSDVIQPTLDRATGRWRVYTCREAGPPNGAVVMFDDAGRELWGHRGLGHMDMGWTGRLAEDGSHRCYALEIGTKTAGPGGFQRGNVTEYLFDIDGKPLPAPYPLYQSLPVDFDGDGWHELVYMAEGPPTPHVASGASVPRRGLVIDRHGQELAQLAGEPAYAGKILNAPGEQIVTWDVDGTVRIYACDHAADSPAAMQRYKNPYYAACLRLWAMAYNRTNLAGI